MFAFNPVLYLQCTIERVLQKRWDELVMVVTATERTRSDPKVISKDVLYDVVMLSEFIELKSSKVKRMTM